MEADAPLGVYHAAEAGETKAEFPHCKEPGSSWESTSLTSVASHKATLADRQMGCLSVGQCLFFFLFSCFVRVHRNMYDCYFDIFLESQLKVFLTVKKTHELSVHLTQAFIRWLLSLSSASQTFCLVFLLRASFSGCCAGELLLSPPKVGVTDSVQAPNTAHY